MPQAQPFVPLHVHSHYSKLDGMSSLSGLVNKASNDSMGALALTDHGNMFGVQEFYNEVNKLNKKLNDKIKGARKKLESADSEAEREEILAEIESLESKKLKPILGCEMYVAERDLHEHIDKRDTGRHLIVLAKNEKGYHNLIKLVSQAYTEGFYSHPRTDKASLAAHREGLIICSACLGGEIPRLLLNGQYDDADAAVAWWKETFGDDYYIELQRHKATVPRANHETYELQRRIEPQLIELARKHGVKIIATNDTHFVEQADAEAHDLLICLATNKYLNDENRMLYSKQEWLKTRAEMWEVFADIPEALENTEEIASKVETFSLEHAPIMPFYEIPKEFGTEEEYRSRITEQQLFDEFTRNEHGEVVMSEEEGRKKIEKLGGFDKLYRIKFEADYLEKLAFEGAAKRYGLPLDAETEERIRFELHVMKTMGFPGYFLIVQDFIRKGREMGVSIGPGRGSAAGSVVAYCLEITKIDPLKYDLLFERFLNPDRISLPDIDVDFDDDGRETVLNYVTERYGAPNVAHIITYGTMGAKSAIKDVARVMNYPIDKSNALTKLVPRHMPVDPKTEKELKPTVANLMKFVPEFQQAMDNEPIVANIMDYARRLEGTVRNTGVHACGVIICRDDVSDWVPVSTAADKNGDTILVTQYEGSHIEETGLIKMDFLGLSNLSIIREAIANIKSHRGIDIDIDNIPLDDAKTFELFSRGATVGTFQFESAGMQRYLRELKPSVFEDLIAMNALYRPGPMENIPEFIARKHGRSPIKYDIPEMEKYLKDTYGITVYQEQVMLLSRLLGGLTRGQSDSLRKAMGKKLIEKMNELKDIFMEGGKKRGHDPEVLGKIWTEWEKFASYAFNKSHATCYSWVAYQTGYLKANYPAEYMAALLSRNLDDIAKMSFYMDECKSMGINVKGPDVNESVEAFSVTAGGDIRFGLCAIKGIGRDVVQKILETRRDKGSFTDIYDFVERVPAAAVNRRVFDNLAYAGAFDCFPTMRESLVAEIGKRGETASELLLRYGAQFQNAVNNRSASLFAFEDDEELLKSSRPVIPQVAPWDNLAKLNKEKELVGIYLSAHPLDTYRLEVEYGADYTIAEKNDLTGESAQPFTFAGMVMEVNNRVSRNGNSMTVVRMEDYSGSTDFIVFERQKAEYARYLIPGSAIMVTGQFKTNRQKEIRFNLEGIRALADLRGRIFKSLILSITPDQLPICEELLAKNIDDGSKDTSERSIEIEFIISDPTLGRHIHFSSALRVFLTYRLLEALEQAEISFKLEKQRTE